jgi:hypothetical protein
VSGHERNGAHVDCWDRRGAELGAVIDIAPGARVSPLADIEDSVRGSRIVVGEGAVTDAFVKIKPAGGDGDVVIRSGIAHGVPARVRGWRRP